MTSTVAAMASASQPAARRDPSPHAIRFVDVQPNVRLEVLDWGGSGRPLVLLTGSGNTAHVFDDFAPQLRSCCHVYGITRRGYGASRHPDSGYDNQRLADDAFARETQAYIDRWVANLKRRVPDARIVNLSGAGHFVFLTRESQVLEEIRRLVAASR